jgi:predicted nuclease of predicted toxin-antitoxin system
VRFLIDAQLPPALARLLNDRAHVAEHVNDVGLGEHPIATCAATRSDMAVIVTKDEDFANMAALRGDAPAVVWVRVGNTRRATLLAWFEPLIDEVTSWSRRAIGSSSCAEPAERLATQVGV